MNYKMKLNKINVFLKKLKYLMYNNLLILLIKYMIYNMSLFKLPLSKALCDYLELPEGSELEKKSVTIKLYEIIKNNNLFDTIDKRKIIANAELRSLFKMTDDEYLEFNNFQIFVSRAFIN